MTKKYAIIVAGGSGKRMSMDIPKQFINIAGMPVMMHTVTAFYNAFPEIEIIVVIRSSNLKFWKTLCLQYNFNIPHQLIGGGNTRFQSVKNGLQLVEDEGLVAIHDAVRPLVGKELIVQAFTEAEKYGSAVPVIPVKDTIRKIHNGAAEKVSRDELRLIQTPQVFRTDILRKSYNIEFKESFTDDAEVVLANGFEVHFFPGHFINIKITHQDDLKIVEALLQKA